MADPAPGAPLEWIEDQHHRRAASDLRAGAVELRHHVAAIAERLRALPAHDRVDVWQSPAADAARQERADASRRLASPYAGALTEALHAARRLDARAHAHDDATVPSPPEPLPTTDVVDLMLDRWSAAPRGTA